MYNLLNMVWDIRFSENERFAGHENDAFIGAASGAGRQILRGRIGYIDPNDRKITGLKFKDIRATVQSNCPCSVLVRVRAKSANKNKICFEKRILMSAHP
jgi:hypothetical protein